MGKETIICSSLVNKIVQEFKIYDDPQFGREVHIDFTDGTAFSIQFKVNTSIEARHYRESRGELDIIQECVDSSFEK